MDVTFEVWVMAWVIGILPVLFGLIWWWNELRYVVPVKARLRGTAKQLPPGHMGLPFLGELITFLWYFKVIGRPDDFINSKRKKYGDGVGIYRTYLFGNPSIIACSADSSRFVLQSDKAFCLQRWPTNDLVGHRSIIGALGEKHKRIRHFVVEAVNQPRALRQIILAVQPRIVASLESWASKGTVTAYDEAKKEACWSRDGLGDGILQMTFGNIGKLFASFEPGPLLDELDRLFQGMVRGMRANPVNIPGTSYHYALKCRKKIESIFRAELERRKKIGRGGSESRNDLMDGLMQTTYENGDLLSDDEVVENISSLVIGGYESASLASMWGMYFLAKNPNVVQKLREENWVIRQNKKGDNITLDDIPQMKYTSKVVEETVRMANIASIVFRMGDRDVEYQGYTIPKGWKVICWLRYLHTDPRNFEDPMCFNPERWNDSVKPSGFQVFGGGARLCAGDMLARMQIAAFFHHLSIGYKWELVNPNAEMEYLPHQKPVDGVRISISKI